MAAQDLEKLVVQLSADVRGYQNALNRAQGQTVKSARAIEARFEKMNGKVDAGLSGLATSASKAFAVLGVVAGGSLAQGFIALSDQATRMANSLKVAGLEGDALQSVYGQLSDAAKANGAPVEALVTLYGRAAQQQKELGVTSAQLIDFSSNVAVALRVAGTDAQAASGSLLQLGQALGSGTIHAEEFNAILDGTPTIAKAAANGLKEANGSVAQLKQLVVSGQVSSKTFFDAFQAGSVVLQQQAAGSTLTVAQAMENLRTQLVDAVMDFNRATGAADGLARTINQLAGGVGNLEDFFSRAASAVSPFIDKVNEAKNAFENYVRSVGNAQVFSDFNRAMGLTADNGQLLNPDVSAAQQKIALLTEEAKKLQVIVSENTRLGLDNTEAMSALAQVGSEIAALQTKLGALPQTMTVVSKGITEAPVGDFGFHNSKPTDVVQVSVKDNPPVSSKSASGGRGRAKKESDYAREIEQIKERTAAILAETDAQSRVNPLIDDYGYASTRASAAQELLTAAQKSGLAAGKELTSVQQLLSGNFDGLSPAAREQATAMLALADGYATASSQAEKLNDRQQKIKAAAEDFNNTSKSVLSGFISDMRNGVSAADALTNALNKVVDKLIDVALNAAFDTSGTGGLGSLFSSLFGGGGSQFSLASAGGLGLYDKGGYTGIGGKNEPAGIVHKGEYVMDAAATKRIGVENLRKLQGYANGGYVGTPPSLPNMRSANDNQQQVAVTVRVDNDGNLKAFVQRESAQVSAQVVQATAPSIIDQSTQSAGAALGKGKFDSSMSKYGVKRQANVG